LDTPPENRFDEPFEPLEPHMNETAQTALVAELIVVESLAKLLLNAAIEIAVADGGNMTRARALLAGALPAGPVAPRPVQVAPAAAKGYDEAEALALANRKMGETVKMLAEQTVLALMRRGIEPSR
jgi:hypothetical protein